MNKSASERVIKTLLEIVSGLRPLKSESELFVIPERGQRFVHDGVGLSISEQSLQLHDRFVVSLLKEDGWSDKFSEKFLDGQLRSLYVRYLRNSSTEDLRLGFENLITRYKEFNTEHLVVVPLGGIVMTIDSLEIGAVTLKRAGKDYLQQKILGSTTGLPQELVERGIQRVLKGRNETVCAEYRIVAEQIRAQERALDECNRALDVLRYAIPELTLPHLNTSIGFEHDALKGDWLRFFTLVVGEDGMPAGGQQNFAFSELAIDAGCVDILNRIGASRLSVVLKKPVSQLNDFEKVLLRAVRWYSIAQKTLEPENKFLNLTTCLETFFTPKDRDPISNGVAEGCAFVLGQGSHKRLAIFRLVKQLYGQRSGLSHGGKTAILESELGEIEYIAWHLLFEMVAKIDQFNSRDALKEWIDEEKFKSPTGQ